VTNDQILQIASRHSAYADCTPTLRGDAILAFARDVILEELRNIVDARIAITKKDSVLWADASINNV